MLAAVTTAAVLALSACGGEKQPGAAAPAPSEAKSSLSSPLGDAIQLAALTRESTKKAKSSKVAMEIVAGAEKTTISGQGLYDGENSKLAMVMESDGKKLDMTFVDNTMYFKLDADDKAELKTDKAYAKISPDGQDPISQLIGKMMSKAIKEGDPARVFEKISKAGKVSKSDQVELDGERTNHYVIDVDPRKAIDLIMGEIGIPLPAETRKQLDAKLEGKNASIVTEMWLNADQLPVQVITDQTAFVKAMGAPGDGVAKTTVKYTDWGGPLTIAAPPADQVGDVVEIMKKSGR
ncbi:hypothetical protein GCM10027598_24430 [Amycolatopsis oliviviridis]|uniref:Lipoprotein n=2 Tax=Amycolatopsis oliviviridis TaxID=1471590 RepID=A0ABQ3LHM3_9PSEU|nr:hypothetical protein GCM10017790_32060 [Amycolatopsis oliviviridis]